jgi:hypothetical protein
MPQRGIYSNFTFLASDAQLVDVIEGLEYLHNLDIPHGDLKGVGRFSDFSGLVVQLC